MIVDTQEDIQVIGKGSENGPANDSQSASTRAQVARFLLVGGTTAVIDFCTYRSVLYLLHSVALAKASGCVVGTVVAFFANRSFTFQSESRGKRQVASFLVLYLLGLIVNVSVNSLSIHLLSVSGVSSHELIINTAFVIATACSATWNFVGMKFFVFGDK